MKTLLALTAILALAITPTTTYAKGGHKGHGHKPVMELAKFKKGHKPATAKPPTLA